jgi:hypothetical protein
VSARLSPALIQALFAEARSLEFGLRIPCEGVYHDRARTMISKTMPANEDIMVCAFPNDNEIWLMRRTVEVII